MIRVNGSNNRKLKPQQAGNVGHAVGMLDVALLEGVVGWHRSMFGGAAGDGLGGVVGGEGLSLLSGGAGSPMEGGDGWHRSRIGCAAGEDLGGGVGGGGMGLSGGAGALGALVNHGRVERP